MTVGSHLVAGRPVPTGVLAESITEACEISRENAPQAAPVISRLEALLARLREQRLQLAVLGQFKRGKSTFLNALMGAPILPMAVTPLTAIPTFIRSGENYHLRTIGLSGETDDISALNVESLQSLLQAHVTEEGNPHNRLNLARVEVTVPAALAESGITLIDSPGVGSTYRHNTETAQGILPECDAALFVVSPDPPITESELEFLSLVRATAPRIILILNKMDVLEEVDKTAAIAFLRRVAANTAGLADAPLFCISARLALRAKMADDRDALEASGLPELEDYLKTFIAKEKAVTLERAVSRKAAALVGELRFETESGLAALRMPLEQLSERLAQFEAAVPHFDAERQTSGDLIAGDRKRILAELDADAELLRRRAQEAFDGEIVSALESGCSENEIAAQLGEKIPSMFQHEFSGYEAKVRQRFNRTMSSHQARAEQLIAHVRRTAADLLAIPYAAPAPEEAFELKKLPYWVSRARETLHVVPPGAADRLLPGSIRKQRVKARLSLEAGDVIRRNVENLRWSLRQNLEDGFRSFEARLDEQLKLALDATREALRRGLQRQSDTETESRAQREAAEASLQRLKKIEDALQHASGMSAA